MSRRADILVGGAGTNGRSAGVHYGIETPAGVLYQVFIDHDQEPCWKKSYNRGLTWTHEAKLILGLTGTNIGVYYDRWSGLASGLIHVVFVESTNSDAHYITIDTENGDAISTETIIFAGVSASSNGLAAIARGRGGNVYCRVSIDNGAEGGFFRLLNVDVPTGAWAARTVDEALASQDQAILLPGFGADNQDMMMFFWDASADEISVKRYDDSLDTWAEVSIATGMVDVPPGTFEYPNWAGAVDLANSRNLVAAWSAVNSVGAKLRVWHVTDAVTTEVANVVTSSAGNQVLCALGIDTTTGKWHVVFAGKEDGSEQYAIPGPGRLYLKCSTDSGATWGAALQLTADLYTYPPGSIQVWACPRFTPPFGVAWLGSEDNDQVRYNLPLRDETLLPQRSVM